MPVPTKPPTLPDMPRLARRTARIGVYDRDLQSGQGEWDEGLFAIFGLDPAAGTPDLQAAIARIHEGDREAFLADLEALTRTPTAGREIRFRVRRADGSVRHVHSIADVLCDADGVPRRLRGVVIDETEAAVAALEARERQAQLERALDMSDMSIWHIDLAAQRIRFNRAGEHSLHMAVSADGVPLDHIRATIHPDDRAAVVAAAEQAARGDAPVDVVARYSNPDGSWRTLLTRRVAERDESGHTVGLLGVTVDLTELEAERRERERVEQASRDQSAFLARVSHELRTPMNAVLGFTELMAADTGHPLDAVQAERLGRIRSAGRHLLALIDDLLELASVDADERAAQWTAVPLASTVAQALPWVTTMAQQHGIDLLTPAALKGVVRADARWLLQVASNLLTNAVKYNRPGGWVRVETRRRVRAGKAQWALVVRDGGRGLSAEQIARLFQPFERLGADRDGIVGSGLGLSLVRRLVQRMDGEVEVLSQPGEGAEFRIWLPAASGGSMASAPAADDAGPTTVPAPPSTAPRPLHVLCIEDNEVNLALVVELIALRPLVRLRTATDGLSGLQAARAEPPDVVLLDLHLPDMHGSEVLRHMRTDAALAHCTVIGLSANAMPEDIRAAMSGGFDDYWTKPIDFRRFLAGIDELVARHAEGVD